MGRLQIFLIKAKKTAAWGWGEIPGEDGETEIELVSVCARGDKIERNMRDIKMLFRLLGEIFRIFGVEVLGYGMDITLNLNINNTLDPDIQFANISSCQTQL